MKRVNTREGTTSSPLLRTILIATGLLVAAIVLALNFAAPQVASGDDAECDNEEFRTGPSANLPDCRAYEQVSPVQKYGHTVWAEMPVATASTTSFRAMPGWAAADGDHLIAMTTSGAQAENPTRGFGAYPQAFQRDENGWSAEVIPGEVRPDSQITGGGISHRLMLPNDARTGMMFNSDALLTPEQPYGNHGQSPGVFYANGGERAKWLSQPPSADAFPEPGSSEFDDLGGGRYAPIGQSDDASTFYFMSQQLLTDEDIDSGRPWPDVWALYRWSDGIVSNVGVLPDGTVDDAGSISPGLTPVGTSTGSLATSPSGLNHTATLGNTNLVSGDGKRALFIGIGTGSASRDLAQLYLFREDQPTLLLSKPEDSDEPVLDSKGVAAIGVYQTAPNSTKHNAGAMYTLDAFADEDLDVVLFSTQDALTDDAPTDTTIIKTYRYAVDGEGGELEYLSELDRSWISPNSPIRETGNVIRMSDDGSRIFFWTPAGELKLWREGASTLTLATGLETNDVISTRGAQFSDDGRTLVFGSLRAIGGEPNHPAGNTPLQNQVYRFEDGVDSVPKCISCPPADAATKGPAAADIATASFYTGLGAVTTPSAASQTRTISADGKKVYFTTTSTLDSRDQNARADVYEWSAEREGNGLALLSSGAASSNGAGLLDFDATGDNVFFVTEDALTASDGDDISDIYVARVGGGLPDPAPFDLEEGCDTGTCQGPASDGPGTPNAGSVDFTGKGNADQSRDPKASVKVKRLKPTSGSKAKLEVDVPGPGKVTVKGKKLKRSSKQAKAAGTVKLALKLNAKAKKALRKRGKVKAKARVIYRSDQGDRASKRVSLTFKKAKGKKGSR